MAKALREYLDAEGIDPAGRELRLSLPCDVHGHDFSFSNLSGEWDFNRHALAQQFGFAQVRVWNDAEAALYSILDLFAAPFDGAQHYEVVVPGDSRQQSRFVLIGPGSGLGAAGAYLERSGDQAFWVPVPSEFGESSGWWKGDELRSVIQDMRRNGGGRHTKILNQMNLDPDRFGYEHFHRREFLVSGPGLMRIYHSLMSSDFATTSDITQPEAIVRCALQHGSDPRFAQTMKLFCEALARSAVDLGLSFTARAGIFLTGSLLNAIGCDGLREFGFVRALVEGRGKEEYPHDVPIYLITHPYPELVGLSRFRVLD